ncbi:MAG: NAD(P)/FAD-dependent oxidoreductase [Methanomicrobiales archaeon]|nr:NAD(P)/FAD-dependent oxidoreductase [Methanomicrobiales archaeon]
MTEYKMMYDVAVVGAGPSGSTAARCCAEAGLSTILIEEHAAIGYPIQCAGLLSSAAFESCGVTRRCIQHTLTGATVYPSAGEPLCLDAGVPKAFAVDRGMLDREMTAMAVSAGAELMLKQYARSFHQGVLDTIGASGACRIGAKIVIAADGVRSPIARSLGLDSPIQILSGIQADIRHASNEGIVEIYPHASPDFFGWLIPIGGGRARIGLLGRDRVRERFVAFLHRFYRRHNTLTAIVTGALPLGARERTYADRVMLVGDAAGLAKPTSGGGVYTGVRSAMHAADVAVRCCELDRFDASSLEIYEKRWKDDFGRELKLGMQLLEVRQSLREEEIDRAISVLKEPELVRAILEAGDMDRPSRLILTLMRHPGIYQLAGLAFMSGLRRFTDVLSPGFGRFP